MSGHEFLDRELRARPAREAALGERHPLTREVASLPDGGGWLRVDVVPERGAEPDEAWLSEVPAQSRLRLTRRFETRYVQPVPERWHELAPEWLARMWDGAEPA